MVEPLIVAHAGAMGVSPSAVTFKPMVSRWGVCNVKSRAICFSTYLLLLPEWCVEHVVVHELCHRLYLNHSKDFWREVERVLPDYRECERWLKKNGSRLMAECDRA